MMRGRMDECTPLLRRALEFTRETGEPEGHFFATLAAAQYHGMRGNHELAMRLMGAADQFIESTGYAVIAVAERQYRLARDAAMPPGTVAANERAWREGRKLRLEDAVVLALHA
jgi:hypothetical protein